MFFLFLQRSCEPKFIVISFTDGSHAEHHCGDRQGTRNCSEGCPSHQDQGTAVNIACSDKLIQSSALQSSTSKACNVNDSFFVSLRKHRKETLEPVHDESAAEHRRQAMKELAKYSVFIFLELAGWKNCVVLYLGARAFAPYCPEAGCWAGGLCIVLIRNF